jgi:hypothetical protein
MSEYQTGKASLVRTLLSKSESPILLQLSRICASLHLESPLSCLRLSRSPLRIPFVSNQFMMASKESSWQSAWIVVEGSTTDSIICRAVKSPSVSGSWLISEFVDDEDIVYFNAILSIVREIII